MRLVKLFAEREDRAQELETDINTWIQESGAEVISVSGNVAPQSQISYPDKKPAPSDVLIVVVYEPATVVA